MKTQNIIQHMYWIIKKIYEARIFFYLKSKDKIIDYINDTYAQIKGFK